MWWGYSPALDFQKEIEQLRDLSEETSLEILVIGATDARHVVKTIASFYTHQQNLHRPRRITFLVVESTLAQIARSMFLLSLCLESNLGLLEATRYYLEIFGNTLLRPATAKYLISRAKKLIEVVTAAADNFEFDWLDLKRLKFKERDAIEAYYKLWIKATCDNIPVSRYWDWSVRQSLGTRYDYKEGAFDWDYSMVLKNRNLKHLTAHEYKFWRENGVAFTWLEGEPVRGNPTLITAVDEEGISRFSYAGDVRNGPFFTWMPAAAAQNNESDENKRASDIAEKEVMRALYEIRNQEPLVDEKFAAHRDSSLLQNGGIILVDLLESTAEQESWMKNDSNFQRTRKDDLLEWIDIPQIKVQFQTIGALNKFPEKEKYRENFDCIWLAERTAADLIPTVAPLLKPKGGILLTETRKFMVNFKDEQVEGFEENLRSSAGNNGLVEIEGGDESNCVLRFCKK